MKNEKVVVNEPEMNSPMEFEPSQHEEVMFPYHPEAPQENEELPSTNPVDPLNPEVMPWIIMGTRF